MTRRFSSRALPDRVAEARLRRAFERGERVFVSVATAQAVPASVRAEAWALVAQKYFPNDVFRLEVADCPDEALEGGGYCIRCDDHVTEAGCRHGPGAWFSLSDERVFELLHAGANLPRELYRPEVAELLRSHLAQTSVETVKVEHPHTTAHASSRGFILWFTGLSGAGKSTLSAEVAKALEAARHPVEVLDGDEVRTYLSRGLGFSREDRDTNVRRIGFVARLLARQGVSVITAAISPYRGVRDEVRELAAREGVSFVEVFASASIEALTERDVKGLYRRALAGDLPHFTGVSDPYEPPLAPEVVAHTDSEPVSVSVERILEHLVGRGLVARRVEER